MPKIRKAKSQSFRSHHRRSPSERKIPGFVNISQAQFNANDRHSPSAASDRSPGSYSAKSPALSRQNTVKNQYHRRKNSISQSTQLNLGQGRRSPLTLMHDRSPSGRRSPNFLSHDSYNKSPLTSPSQRRSPLLDFNHSSEKLSPSSALHGSDYRNFSLKDRKASSRSSISSDKRSVSPTTVLYNPQASIIPPITISNPNETYPSIPIKSITPTNEKGAASSPCKSPTHEGATKKEEKKEKSSVMKEILNFVRKPSKKVTTQTSKFTAAFTRRESGSGSPLIRQSTFSSIPNTSSRAGKHMITKQQSQIERIEPKMSFKSKMSLRLRRFEERRREKEKKSSGDEVSDKETSDSGITRRSPDFDIENVHFDKVGNSSQKDGEDGEAKDEANGEESNLQAKMEHVYEELKKTLDSYIEKNNEENGEVKKETNTIQCPIIEFEPPSRRASFDPPRSPYLENLRSLSSTDHSRFDSSLGDSFEMVEHRESSIDDRYSSVSTSFDISRYQSTSYEDANSSFEVIEGDMGTNNANQARKSSIELVDSDTFAKSSPKGRKSSIETHFELSDNYKPPPSSSSSCNKGAGAGASKQQRKKHFPVHYRPRSPLSYQTSSNYSSRDSYESSNDPEVRHYFMPPPQRPPRPKSKDRAKNLLGPTDTSSGSEFEPPSPRRAASASPKHTFTFRIVLKKVESSPDAICPSAERRSRERVDRHKRRDSRRKKLMEQGKSF